MIYAYISSADGAFIVSNSLPSDVGMWWNVDEGADPNALALTCVMPVDENGEADPDAWPEIVAVQVPFPAPHPGMSWDENAGAWRDARNADECAADLDAWRASACMPRAAFCLFCAQRGVFSDDEAIEAARGEMPPVLMQVFDEMAGEVRLSAKASWAGSTHIRRNDDLVRAVAVRFSISDVETDAAFRGHIIS